MRGGAELVRSGDSDQDRKARDNTTEMVAAVLAELPFASVAVLDASPFGLEVAYALYRHASLIVVTNNLRAAYLLAGRPDVITVTLTGHLDLSVTATVGDRVIAQLSEVSADVSVISPAGFSLSAGPSVANRELAAVSRAMLGAGRRRVVAVKSSAIGHDAGFAFGTTRGVDVLITDATSPSALVGDARTRPFALRVVEGTGQAWD